MTLLRPRLFLLAVLAALASCASAQEHPPDFVDPQLPGHDTNPDGLAYPTDHLGGTARTGRTHPGDRIPNFSFQAYVNGDRAAGLKTISMADYFDPKQARNKVLHMEVSAVWCAICSSVTDETVKVKEALATEGVVYLEVITAGATPGIGPSQGEVDDWVTRHMSNLTTAIDVRATRLAGIGVDPGVRPWDIVVDTRSMEILESSGGSPIDVATYARSYLKLVASFDPPY